LDLESSRGWVSPKAQGNSEAMPDPPGVSWPQGNGGMASWKNQGEFFFSSSFSKGLLKNKLNIVLFSVG